MAVNTLRPGFAIGMTTGPTSWIGALMVMRFVQMAWTSGKSLSASSSQPRSVKVFCIARSCLRSVDVGRTTASVVRFSGSFASGTRRQSPFHEGM